MVSGLEPSPPEGRRQKLPFKPYQGVTGTGRINDFDICGERTGSGHQHDTTTQRTKEGTRHENNL